MMKRHLFCLTIDTDPDGLNAKVANRRTLRWDGLVHAQSFPSMLEKWSDRLGGAVPITWFVRVDGQLRDALGSPVFLLEQFAPFWSCVQSRGDELGWHPHLYRCSPGNGETELITDPAEASDELERVWVDCDGAGFLPTSFRNGEGWHCPQTLRTVERLGLTCDSTAIPGRVSKGHPLDWRGTPNQPYYPDADDIRRPGRARPLLEVPMNSWFLQAPHDVQPKVRYMNPAVHPALFANAADNWSTECQRDPRELFVWALILHPDEILSAAGADGLYARSPEAVCQNLCALTDRLQQLGHAFEFVTISKAAMQWRAWEAA
jgi:hypothetical protein